MVLMLVSCTNQNQSAEAGKADEVVMANDSKSKSNIMVTQKITPYLWVEKDAKAVADYYLSIFKDGKLKDFRRFDSSETGNDAAIVYIPEHVDPPFRFMLTHHSGDVDPPCYQSFDKVQSPVIIYFSLNHSGVLTFFESIPTSTPSKP